MSPNSVLREIEKYANSLGEEYGIRVGSWEPVRPDEIASDPDGVGRALWVAILSIIHMETRRGWNPADR